MSKDKIIRSRLKALDQLPRSAKHPSNIALVNIDDVIEIFHDLKPYTMRRLDDLEAKEALIKEAKMLADRVLSL